MSNYTVYPDEPTKGSTLTNKEIIKVLDDHSIQHLTTTDDEIMMLDEYTLNQELFSEWVPAKKTYGELIAWLGY